MEIMKWGYFATPLAQDDPLPGARCLWGLSPDLYRTYYLQVKLILIILFLEKKIVIT